MPLHRNVPGNAYGAALVPVTCPTLSSCDPVTGAVSALGPRSVITAQSSRPVLGHESGTVLGQDNTQAWNSQTPSNPVVNNRQRKGNGRGRPSTKKPKEGPSRPKRTYAPRANMIAATSVIEEFRGGLQGESTNPPSNC